MNLELNVNKAQTASEAAGKGPGLAPSTFSDQSYRRRRLRDIALYTLYEYPDQ